ncbi:MULTISPECIES: division/cell wall cluster transcriptional repressor MraZ [Furfurilactobacillus]|uniref:Transcriptional regulator MraZ n=3 Tax=Furfurilactobacillus TaxID=2767882 RepID=A0A0R1R8X3_9LACO|nr:division/cell wall cluster transcriptional repressor MraZ [Furfurilactobacillus rossiae]MYV04632.1 division/cell wall cluster transcriptional repressor MraZ [Furfurilactobacillus milii]KRL53137.1 cell division protein MraZ [Furfurilactobacillus rossiae DSM 15814]MCF6165937.1 division/cell wall cluster transcriptional repressor MraZ [Furfurilactobacillus rossiae]MYV18124.1 division/cell wall cluster transcriptional repressor MraZ [Furfurilactobacillus milii]QFR66258.1 division/cell wall clus
MFIGEFQHNVDDKGRLIIPAKFRNQLGEKFMVTRGMDGCLFGYPEAEWSALVEKTQTLSLTKRDARAFSRFLFSGATECEFDKQGRINIPTPLRNHAKLTKACVIVGVSDRFEIWDADTWQQYNESTEANIDDISESMGDFDF